MSRADADQRARILEASITVFADLGLRGATIRRVAQEADVNSALIYYYFEDKETLFLDALHHVLRGFLGSLQERCKELQDGADRIRFLVEGLFDYFTRYPERMRLLKVGLSAHPDFFGRLLNRTVRESSLIPIEVIAEGMHRGELRGLHPLAVWWSILGMCMFSLEMQQVVRHLDASQMPVPVPDLPQRKQAIIAVLTDGLSLRKTAEDSKPSPT
jgi:TetR/AcrR family transcriptional regulator